MSEKFEGVVANAFRDKDTKEHHAADSVYVTEDADRIKFLQEKGFLKKKEKENVSDNDNGSGEGDNDSDVEQYHTGGGYYELPNGEKVRGKNKAADRLKELEQSPPTE